MEFQAITLKRPMWFSRGFVMDSKAGRGGILQETLIRQAGWLILSMAVTF